MGKTFHIFLTTLIHIKCWLARKNFTKDNPCINCIYIFLSKIKFRNQFVFTSLLTKQFKNMKILKFKLLSLS